MGDNTNDFKAELPSIHRAVAKWYKEHGRHSLPWRNTKDPYAIYISEVMLQQTQVKTVLERYYQPFLKRFPSLKALAKANRQDVMKQWEGLGYYNRAANLHAAAQQSGEKLPDEIEALMELSGIGRNTAHAIACFAFGAACPVMEANVRRVLCRVFAMKKIDEKLLWQHAADLLDTKNPFNFNQAMMDIGAMVCTKRSPQCGICPFNSICKGKEDPTAYPIAKLAKEVPVRQKAIIVIRDNKGFFYVQKRETRFLNGLYGFIECKLGTKSIKLGSKIYKLTQDDELGHITQTYSHFILDALVYLVSINALAEGKSTKKLYKADLRDIQKLPLSRADSKVVAMIARHIA